MKNRLGIALGLAALVVAALGTTSAGQAAGDALKASVGNSGIAGPLATQAVTRGPRGPRGRRGPRGLVGPRGPVVPQDQRERQGTRTGANGTQRAQRAQLATDEAHRARGAASRHSSRREDPQRDVYSIEAQATGAGQAWSDAPTFPFPLANAITAASNIHYISRWRGGSGRLPRDPAESQARPQGTSASFGSEQYGASSVLSTTFMRTSAASRASRYGFSVVACPSRSELTSVRERHVGSHRAPGPAGQRRLRDSVRKRAGHGPQ